MASIEYDVLSADDAAVARVVVHIGQVDFKATASSKKHPSDPVVVAVGEALALSRAFDKVADDLVAYAMATNEQHINMREAIKLLDGYEW